MKNSDVSTDTLAECREALRQEGPLSPTARTLFRAFYDSWYETVLQWAEKVSGPGWAADVTQKAFWKAWEWLNGPSGLPKPATLLRTCVERAGADLYREIYSRAAPTGEIENIAPPGTDARFPLSLDYADDEMQTLVDAIADSTDISQEVEDREVARLLREQLARLPQHYRNCVTCRHLQERSVAETAAILGLSKDQVVQYTARGLLKLQVLVAQAYRGK